MPGDLSPESLARIEQVRANELSIDQLTDAELDGMLTSHAGAAEQPAPSGSTTGERTAEDGGDDGKTANAADTSEDKPRKRTKKEIADEANHYRQLWDGLPHKLKDEKFRAKFLADMGVETAAVLKESDFDKNDLYKAKNLETLIEKVEKLENKDTEAAMLEMHRIRKEAVLEDIEDFIAENPELAPKQGSLRKLNSKAERLWEYAGRDVSKMSDAAFLAQAEAEGYEIVRDENFERLSAIRQIKESSSDPQFTMQDAYAVWLRRNPGAAPAKQATPATATTDRAQVLVGGNAGAGGATPTKTLGQRAEEWNAKWGMRSSIPASAEAEWAQIEKEFAELQRSGR